MRFLEIWSEGPARSPWRALGGMEQPPASEHQELPRDPNLGDSGSQGGLLLAAPPAPLTSPYMSGPLGAAVPLKCLQGSCSYIHPDAHSNRERCSHKQTSQAELAWLSWPGAHGSSREGATAGMRAGGPRLMATIGSEVASAAAWSEGRNGGKAGGGADAVQTGQVR